MLWPEKNRFKVSCYASLTEEQDNAMPFLGWVNKNQAKAVSTAVPYPLLQKEAGLGTPCKDNMIIQGDNLLALRALMPLYAGQVKCIFVDPPCNTQSALKHYDGSTQIH